MNHLIAKIKLRGSTPKYRTEYVQMLDFALTFVREWEGLSSDYFNITTEFLEKYDDSWEYDEDYEGCWEIYT